MDRKVSLFLLGMLAFTVMVSAGGFNINYGGSKIFTVATNGTASIINLSVTQLIEATGNISTSAYFVGDGSYLTGISIDDNTTTLSYHNITDIPTCGAGNYLTFDGTDMSCSSALASNTTTLSYHNITDIPTCGAGDYLTFDGTDMSCDTPTTTVDWTNNAWLNESQTFAEYSEFTKYVNITEGVRLMSNTSVITRDGIENVNITIDSSGNINFNLG